MSETVTIEAYRLRGIAEAGPIGKRHTSFELYDLLGRCMMLAERCRSRESYDEIRGLVLQQPRAGKRRYVERGSDEYILVCRFVFSNLRSGGAERSNASRYAHCLRQAAKAGISGTDLAKHLSERGGVNALFLGRPLDAQTVTTKSLRLDRAITVGKDQTFTLTLRR